MGRSASWNRMSSKMCSMPRATPTAEMNSDTTTSAPNRRHSSRNGDSETPDIGARKSGTSCATRYGKCMADSVMTRCVRGNHSLRYLPVLGKIAQFAKEADVPEKLAKLGSPKEFLRLVEDKNS